MNENVGTSSQQLVHVEEARHPAGSSPWIRRVGVALFAGLLYLLLVDAAVETFHAGAPVRWIVGATVTAYVALSVLLRRKLTADASASASLLVLFGLLAITAWRSGGAIDGITIVRQPTSAVLSAATALAILLAGWMVVRLKILPVPLRAVVGLLALYGLAGVVWGIVAATPYPALFHGKGLWMRLPFWLQGVFIGGIVLLPAGVILLVFAAVAGMRGRRRGIDALLAAASALSLAVVVAGLAAAGGAGGVAGGTVGQPAWVAAWKQIGINGPGLRRDAAPLQLPVPRLFDLSHVESANVAVALGKDPSRIFQYVRDQIAYEPYAGCLRGPRGVLLAMAGNSIDRAALLASLLQQSGYRVRYARGLLPEPLAQQLVASVWIERQQLVPLLPQGEAPAAVTAAADVFDNAIGRDAALLHDNLEKAGHPMPRESAVSPESLVKEAQDHYWVEWLRDGTWVDLDPSFATATPGQRHAKVEETFDALPATIFHRVGIRIRFEEYTGDKPSVHEVLRYSTTAADLSGVDVVLIHQATKPNGQAGSLLGGLSAPGQDTGQVKPVLLIRNQPITGLPFRLQGSGGASGGIEGLLGGGGETTERPVATATAEFVDLDFAAPDGSRETVVREIFDLVGQARRRSGGALSAKEVAARSHIKTAHDLTTAAYDFFFTTGSIDGANFEKLATPPPPAGGEPLDVRGGLRRVNIAFAAVSDSFLGRLANKRGSVYRFYPQSPRVYIAELSTRAGAPRLGLDLRRDQARALVTGFRPEQLFYAQVVRGVVDAALERIVIDYFAGSDKEKDLPWASVFSTSLLFERARALNAPTVLLAGESPGPGSDVPEDSRARIQDALGAGYVLLAPKEPVEVAGVPRFAWWQIDPRSGTTIAVTDEGLHQGMVEYRITKDKDGAAVTIKTDAGVYHGHFDNPHDAADLVSGLHWRIRDLIANRQVIFKGVNEFLL
jgi:hypothetical protein